MSLASPHTWRLSLLPGVKNSCCLMTSPRGLPPVELHNVEVARPRGKFPFPVFQGAQGYHNQVRPPQSVGPAFSTSGILGAGSGYESS